MPQYKMHVNQLLANDVSGRRGSRKSSSADGKMQKATHSYLRLP